EEHVCGGAEGIERVHGGVDGESRAALLEVRAHEAGREAFERARHRHGAYHALSTAPCVCEPPRSKGRSTTMMQQPAPQQGSSSNMMLIIGGVVALLLLCCCGGGI